MKVRTPITMLILLGILLGAAYYGWSTVASPDDEKEPQTRTGETGKACTSTQVYKKGTKIRARTITVSVYNAGLVSGLAEETLADLVAKGFRRGDADNAPVGVATSNVAILTNTEKSPQVMLVARQFQGEVTVIKGEAIRPGVNVVVGDNFRGVDDGAKRRLVLKRKVTTCTAGSMARSGES